jgi:2-haloacid dehalogenase
MPYEWLLFDADNTLFDFDRAEEKALEMAFADAGLIFLPKYIDDYRVINKQMWSDFEKGIISQDMLRTHRFDRLFEPHGLSFDAERFSAYYLRNLALCGDLIAGAEDLMDNLRTQYHLGIITNGIVEVQRLRLANSPIVDCFEVVAISGELGVAKPDVRFFDAVFNMIGQPKHETVLVIGDSLTSDIQGANNYGLDACWFNPHGKLPGPQYDILYEICDLGEILNILH